MNKVYECKFYYFFFLFVGLPFFGNSQNKPKVFFKEGDTLRLESNSNQYPEKYFTIVVPKNNDTLQKNNVPNQDTIKNGKIVIEVDKQNSTVLLSKVKLPYSSEFELDSLTKRHEFIYNITIPRDEKDDKVLVLIMKVKNKNGEEINELSKKITFYIKPLILDTIKSGRNYELWLMTGTNFDLFDGIKAQEFFFRANNLFKITDKFFGQIAFYKNRSFSIDTPSNSLPFSSVKRPNLGDSNYTLTSGDFRRTTKQTTDPIAFQFDILHKLTSDSESNFFVTAGLEFATTTVTINNNYNYLDTTINLKTSKPDTVKGYNSFGTTSFSESISYRKSNYNLNVGFMWILNEDDVNIKTQLTGGISNYVNLISNYQSRGNGIIYNFESQKKCYLQMRMFATYKPLGLCFGLESFIRQTDVPTFNFTLSKAFDIKGFIKNFTPVSNLNISKKD